MTKMYKTFKYIQIFIGVIFCLGCVNKPPTEDKTKQGDNFSISIPNLSGRDLPIVVICYERSTSVVFNFDKTKEKPERHPIILMVWSDGSVLYSSDFMQGGSPYQMGRIDTPVLDTFFKHVRSALSWDQSLYCYDSAPDADTISIFLRDHDQSLYMNSWFELREESGMLVCTATAAESLDGRKLSDVINEQPAGYQKFRTLWETIRKESKTLIPKESESITPVIESRIVQIQAKPLDEDWDN